MAELPPQTLDLLEKWLRELRGTVCFTDVTKVYAPTCYGRCVREVERLRDRINEIFGGATMYEATGCWFNDKEKRIEC